MTQKVLDVPYYRQIDLENGLNSYWQNRSCGILALKMVIDYYRLQSGKSAIELSELFEKALANGGTNENGDWLHSALVRTAQDYGFLSWRRSWRPADRDKAFFQSEGVNVSSLASWEKQVKNEAVPTLVRSVMAGQPVVVSAAKNFNEIDKNHDVVLTGIKGTLAQLEGFFFNDPYTNTNETEGKDRYVPLAELQWTYRAIFVVPKAK